MKSSNDCNGVLHEKAIEGLKLFNEGEFFEAHEELETAWRDEAGEIRNLYKGILQVAVAYLHITRGNFEGAVKVYGRSLKWLRDWPDVCRGIHVKKFRDDAEVVISELEKLGKENIGKFNKSYFKQIVWNTAEDGESRKIWICDRCGSEMHEKNCKVSCPNCGNRFDCSDLNIYFD
jgi:rubrerythrin